MKNTRRFISAVMALTMVSAIAPMSAFAINQDDVAAGNNTGTMTATYDVTAKYTVTIPAGVTLDSTNAVSKNIEASDVMLESGKKIKVTLTLASNTASGSSFSAKNDKGDSTATYTISKGETAVAVGDVVAEFTENGKQALTFSKAEGATYAGTHTETLTFGISVEDAVVVKTLTVGDVTLDYCDGDTWQQIVDRNPDKIKTTSGGGWEVRISKINGSFTSWNLCKGSIGNTNYVYADHVVDPNATYVWWE